MRLKEFFGQESLTDDKYLALSMLASAKVGATGYLMASLESATPEIRHFYSNYCVQMGQAHEAFTALAIERGWYTAYGEPESQLRELVTDSMKFIQPQA